MTPPWHFIGGAGAPGFPEPAAATPPPAIVAVLKDLDRCGAAKFRVERCTDSLVLLLATLSRLKKTLKSGPADQRLATERVYATGRIGAAMVRRELESADTELAAARRALYGSELESVSDVELSAFQQLPPADLAAELGAIRASFTSAAPLDDAFWREELRALGFAADAARPLTVDEQLQHVEISLTASLKAEAEAGEAARVLGHKIADLAQRRHELLTQRQATAGVEHSPPSAAPEAS